MYYEEKGWRARIGVISPPLISCSSDNPRIYPEGVVTIWQGLFPPIQRVGPEHLQRAYGMIEEAAKFLAAEEVEYIIALAAPIFTLAGFGSDRKMIERIKELTGLPSTTSITADMWAFDRLGAKKIAIASPMSQEVEDKYKTFLTVAGYQVVAAKSLGIVRNADLLKLGKRIPYQLGKEVLHLAPEADCLYLPCMRWPVVENIELLEKDFNKPVVATTLSTVTKALTELGIKDRWPGLGRLMSMV